MAITMTSSTVTCQVCGRELPVPAGTAPGTLIDCPF